MHEGHRQRLKKKFLSGGITSLEDHEVLELLLFYTIPKKDTNPLAHRLIEHFGGNIKAVFGAKTEELVKIDGIGEHTASLIKLVPQIASFYMALDSRDKAAINNSQEAGMYVCSKIGLSDIELFAVMCLDAQRNIQAFEILERGTVSQANIHPRKIVECALRYNAASVILAHNHPSGGTAVSEDDRIMTKNICPVLEGMGIEVIDHIIATSGHTYISMSDHGLMPN